MNKDITVLLILKDRAPFTWRWMDYYNQEKMPFKVVIADGGSDKSVEKLANTNLYPDINYEYIRYPYDKDIPTFYRKILDALSLVKTKYVIFASNDDFYIIKGLINAVDFLNENADYVSYRSNIYGFRVLTEKTEIDQETGVYGTMTGIRKTYADISITEDSSLERIKIFSENYHDSLWHYVCNTEKLRQCYKILLNSNITDLEVSDFLINYLLVAAGKIHCSNSGLHMLHQETLNGLGRTLSKKNPFEKILDESWPDEISKIFNLTAAEVSKNDGISAEYASKKIMQYYMCHIFGKRLIGDYIKRKIVTKPPKIVTWSHILNKDNRIRLFLKKLYLFTKEKFGQYKSDKIITTSIFRDDISKIKVFLKNRAGAIRK